MEGGSLIEEERGRGREGGERERGWRERERKGERKGGGGGGGGGGEEGGREKGEGKG